MTVLRRLGMSVGYILSMAQCTLGTYPAELLSIGFRFFVFRGEGGEVALELRSLF